VGRPLGNCAKTLVSVAVLAGFAVAVPAAAQQPTVVKLQQVFVDLPSIKVYMDVLDANGKPVPSLVAADFKAAVADRWLPVKSVTQFQSTGQGVAYAVLIDTSLSISMKRFEEIRAAVALWIDRLGANDRMALLRVGTKPEFAQRFTASHSDLIAALNGLKQNSDRTALYASLVAAMDSYQTAGALPERRAIVVLTDGVDDDDTTGRTSDDVLKKINDSRVPIYAIGITAVPPTPSADQSLKTLAELAALSNGLYLPLGRALIADLYEEIRQVILRVYVGSLSCDSCPHDGRPYGFKMVARGVGSDVEQIILLPPDKQEPWDKELRVWIILALVVVLASLVIGWFLKRRKGPETGILPIIDLSPVPDPLPPFPPSPSRPPGIPIVFAVVGKQKKYQAELVDRIVVGRGSLCAISIPGDDSVAEHHCEIFQRDGLLYIRDLDKPGATSINGAPMGPNQKLQSGDKIRLGGTDFHILVGASK